MYANPTPCVCHLLLSNFLLAQYYAHLIFFSCSAKRSVLGRKEEWAGEEGERGRRDMEAISREWQGLLFDCLCVSVETKRERKKGQLSEANTREAGVADACHQNNFFRQRDEKGTNRNHVIKQQDDVDEDDDDDQPKLLCPCDGITRYSGLDTFPCPLSIPLCPLFLPDLRLFLKKKRGGGGSEQSCLQGE